MEKRISGHTGLMALFGTPVGHSGSPAMYNFSFQHDGLDYAYMAFDGTCTLELVIDAGIATGMVCPLGRCNRRGNAESIRVYPFIKYAWW